MIRRFSIVSKDQTIVGNVSGAVSNIHARQVDLTQAPKHDVLDAVAALVLDRAQRSQLAAIVKVVDAAVAERGDVSPEDVARVVKRSVEDRRIGWWERNSLRRLVRDLSVGVAGGVVATGIVDGVTQALGAGF